MAVLESDVAHIKERAEQLQKEQRNIYRLFEDHMRREEQDRKEILETQRELRDAIHSLKAVNSNRKAFIAGALFVASGLWGLAIAAFQFGSKIFGGE